MSQPSADVGGSDRPGSCKIDRVVAEYGIAAEAERLGEYWTRDTERYSLRGLAEYFNQQVLRTAMEREGMNPLDGEVENVHRLLTGDEVSQGMRTQARNRLDRNGVDVDALTADFVSYQTVNRHLKDCLGVERTTNRDENTRTENAGQRIAALRNRTMAVTENTLGQLRSADGFALGETDVFVDITLTCTDCGTHATVEELIENDGCRCGDGDGES